MYSCGISKAVLKNLFRLRRLFGCKTVVRYGSGSRHRVYRKCFDFWIAGKNFILKSFPSRTCMVPYESHTIGKRNLRKEAKLQYPSQGDCRCIIKCIGTYNENYSVNLQKKRKAGFFSVSVQYPDKTILFYRS